MNLDREQAFHDEWASQVRPEDVLVEVAWNASTSPERRWMRQHLGDLRGKRVLDLGCGAGEGAVWFALQGADVVASDLSPGFLDLVQRTAEYHEVQLATVQGSASDLDLPEASFDVIYAANVLHHVDLESTLQACHRWLKPGGLFVSCDPLGHNPLIEVYRWLAHKVRTVDEKPLDMSVLETFARLFGRVEYECFWLFSLWIFLQFFLVERVHPSSQRYWIKILEEHERLTPLYNRLDKLDRFWLNRLPFLKRYCWNIAVAARK